MKLEYDPDSNEVLSPVRFFVRDEAVDRLKKRAAEIDDEEHGSHLAEYTVPQALIVVFHSDPEFLFNSNGDYEDRILIGWVFEPSDEIWGDVTWVPEGTPEDDVIEEDPA